MTSMTRWTSTTRWMFCLVAATAIAGAVEADIASFTSDRDNTLIESATGSLSNGAGQHFFAGRTNQGAGAAIRRGLIRFDVAGNVPALATIDSVTLTLNMSKEHFFSGPEPISLHPVLADWGEGASVGGLGEAMGAQAAAGDATWLHTSFSSGLWANAGGDYSATASATVTVDEVGSYTWGSTSQMVADVQSWLDNPATNFGWAVIGDEVVAQSAKRFDTYQNLVEANRPVLAIDFTPIPEPAALCGLGLAAAGLALRRR